MSIVCRLAAFSMVAIVLIGCGGSPGGLQVPGSKTNAQLPLYPNGQRVNLQPADQSALTRAYFRDLAPSRYASVIDVSWTKDTGKKVQEQLDNLLPNANWRIETEWANLEGASLRASVWRNGDVHAVVAYMDNLDSETLASLNRRYGLSGVEPGGTLIVSRIWDVTLPAPTATPPKPGENSLTLPAPTATPPKPGENSLTLLAPTATPPKPGENSLALDLGSGVTMPMVRVPAGEFIMGSTDQDIDAIMKECSGCNADTRKALESQQKPQHTVDLAEYWIGKYEVTNAQYAAFAAATQRDWKAPEGKADHPVVNVTWADATAFCQWAGEASGQPMRLPTEAEWEAAARGTDGRTYPWGDDPPDKMLANFNGNEKDTTPVGKYSPQGDSPYGAADMAGNVLEWVADWYGETYYASSPASNPTGPASGEYRVTRGGSWYYNSSLLRASYRYRILPDYNRCVDLGYRCAR